MKPVLEPGDRLVLADASNTGGRVKQGSLCTFVGYYEGELGRIWVRFDGDTRDKHGNINRFRKLTKLEKALT